MCKLHGTVNPLRILLSVLMASLLPFQAFAYQPAITTQTLPDATVGAFYHVQLLTEGFGKRIAWSAEGLPDGLEIDPISGIIFGTAQKPGAFEILVTVQSGWKWWRPKTDSKPFHLYVSPQPAQEPAETPASDAAPKTPAAVPPQTGAGAADSIAAAGPQDEAGILAASTRTVVKWISAVQKGGESNVADSTAVVLTFSDSIGVVAVNYRDYILIEGQKAEFNSYACDDSGDNYIYTLGLTNISEELKNEDEIRINLVDLDAHRITVDCESKPVSLYFAAPEPSDGEKVQLALDELKQTDMLGDNTSSSNITGDLSLPLSSTVSGCTVSWHSSKPGIISDSGAVTRPEAGGGNIEVTLTATVTCNEQSANTGFVFTVIAKEKAQVEPPPEDQIDNRPEDQSGNQTESQVESQPEPQSSSQPEPQKESSSGASSGILAHAASSKSKTSGSKSGFQARAASADTASQTSANVGKNGALSHTSVLNDLKTALERATKSFAVINTKNASDVSPEILKALALAAEAEGKQAVLHADTMTQNGKVDARLYVKTESLAEITGPIKLGIATQGKRPEKVKSFFEKYFANEVSVISCEQQGSFGAKLQIAAKVKLPEDTGNLVFYSYDANTNTFSRIVTAYRIDANGYLRFATELAGDLVVSNGTLKKR